MMKQICKNLIRDFCGEPSIVGNSGPHIRATHVRFPCKPRNSYDGSGMGGSREWVGGNGGPVDPSELDLRPVDPGYLLYITDEILPIV